MNRFSALSSVLAASVVALLATAVQAAPIYTPLGDSGTLEVTTYSPSLQVATAPLGSVYGAPVITTSGSTITLTFTPTSGFFAAANNLGGGEKEAMTGKLDFEITLDSPLALSMVVKENGLFNTSGNGTVGIFGGAVVQSVGGPNPAENASNGNLASAATYNSLAGSWTAALPVTGIQFNHSTYRITVDNDLFAQSVADQIVGTASIAKKNFSIIITTTQGGDIPEPASLGVLALGGLGLLARRRRA